MANKFIIPEIPKIFGSNSIGIEAELTGVYVGGFSRQSREFGAVTDANGKTLFMLTKDMGKGLYTKKNLGSDGITVIGETVYSLQELELVSFPYEIQNTVACELLKEAMTWFYRVLEEHMSKYKDSGLEDLVSADGRFKMYITTEHILTAQPGVTRILMSHSRMQITIGVIANQFGFSSTEELRILESAEWYKPEFKDKFLREISEDLKDRERSAIAFAYIASIELYLARLTDKYNIEIYEWAPRPRLNDKDRKYGEFGDPNVKNAWTILPRTKATILLLQLDDADQSIVKRKLFDNIKTNPLFTNSYNSVLLERVHKYIMIDGLLAGHNYDDSKIGEMNEQAMLFEYRKFLPEGLKKYLPPEPQPKTWTENSLEQFDDHKVRSTIMKEVKDLIETYNTDFESWFKSVYKNRPFGQAKINDKIDWLIKTHPDLWTGIITRASGNNGQNVPLPNFGGSFPPPPPPNLSSPLTPSQKTPPPVPPRPTGLTKPKTPPPVPPRPTGLTKPKTPPPVPPRPPGLTRKRPL